MKILDCKLAYVLLAALPLLTGCGGGGGSSPTAFPLDAAASAFYSSARSFTVTNNDTPDTFTITYDLTPGADATFEGVIARTLVYTATLQVNGIAEPPEGGTDYFQVSPYRYLGTRYNDSTYEVAANQGNLPTTAKIGDSGDFYTSTTYTNDSKTTVEETAIVRWSMERDPGSKSRAYFCVNQEVTFPIPVADDVKSVASCYRLDEAGSILSVRLTYISADGSRITFD